MSSRLTLFFLTGLGGLAGFSNLSAMPAAVPSIDPLYSASEQRPATDELSGKAPWLYADTGLETYLLARMRRRSEEVCFHVGYPGDYARPAAAVTYRLTVAHLPATVNFRAAGRIVVSLDGSEVFKANETSTSQVMTLPETFVGKRGRLEIRLTAAAGEPPALLIEDGPCSTLGGGWESSSDSGKNWTAARPVAQRKSGAVPHRTELPTMELTPVAGENGLFDFGRTILGRVVFQGGGEAPVLWVGESPAEALSDNPETREQRTTLERLADGRWRSRFQLAFRYARITGGAATDVKVEAVFYPVQYRGAFACSDEQLTAIWMNSAFTLRSCMNDLMLDGMKRDRLPWMGDQEINLMVNAYTFAEPEMVRRTFTALGASGIQKSDINGIVDYSLWAVINQDAFQRYFDDPVNLRREWPRIQALLNFMETRCDTDGFLVPRPGSWLFIDWGMPRSDPKRVNVPLQMLWFWALRSGSALAGRMDNRDAETYWAQRADSLAAILQARAWDSQAEGWRFTADNGAPLNRYSNILAVLSGLANEAQRAGIKRHLLDGKLAPVGTPFMKTLELTALSRVGAGEAILPRMDAYWGAQLAAGATTFWEVYNPACGAGRYAMYGRPFGNSLCHAWGSGPAAILPAEILGVRPLADGWKRFSIDPQLGRLTWATATVPTPQGPIEIDVGHGPTKLTIPAGTTAVYRGREFRGPARVTLN